MTIFICASLNVFKNKLGSRAITVKYNFERVQDRRSESERWRPRRLARRRPAAEWEPCAGVVFPPNAAGSSVRRRDAAEPAGGTPALRRANAPLLECGDGAI